MKSLEPKPLNNQLASSSFINLDFLLPHITHFDNNVSLSFLTLLDLHFQYFFYISNSMTTHFL